MEEDDLLVGFSAVLCRGSEGLTQCEMKQRTFTVSRGAAERKRGLLEVAATQSPSLLCPSVGPLLETTGPACLRGMVGGGRGLGEGVRDG